MAQMSSMEGAEVPTVGTADDQPVEFEPQSFCKELSGALGFEADAGEDRSNLGPWSQDSDEGSSFYSGESSGSDDGEAGEEAGAAMLVAVTETCLAAAFQDLHVSCPTAVVLSKPGGKSLQVLHR